MRAGISCAGWAASSVSAWAAALPCRCKFRRRGLRERLSDRCARLANGGSRAVRVSTKSRLSASQRWARSTSRSETEVGRSRIGVECARGDRLARRIGVLLIEGLRHDVSPETRNGPPVTASRVLRDAKGSSLLSAALHLFLHLLDLFGRGGGVADRGPQKEREAVS